MKVEFYEVEFEKPTSRFKAFSASVYEFVSSILSAIICVAVVIVFMFRIATVDGFSMMPTLTNTDRLLISNVTETYDRGDIVVISRVDDVSLVKRVIAVAGDVIDIDFEKGIVYVNGKEIDEEYIYEPTYRSFPDGPDFPLKVPLGYVFVMGDNRNNSLDSRSGQVGLVNEQSILGKMVIDFDNKDAE